MSEEVKTQSKDMSSVEQAARIIAIVIFSLVMTALLTALITDGAIFSKQILAFI